MEEKVKMHTKQYLVRDGEEVDLRRRSTTVDPVYGSKSHYEEILASQRGEARRAPAASLCVQPRQRRRGLGHPDRRARR
jgi:hypothetical protein